MAPELRRSDLRVVAPCAIFLGICVGVLRDATMLAAPGRNRWVLPVSPRRTNLSRPRRAARTQYSWCLVDIPASSESPSYGGAESRRSQPSISVIALWSPYAITWSSPTKRDQHAIGGCHAPHVIDGRWADEPVRRSHGLHRGGNRADHTSHTWSGRHTPDLAASHRASRAQPHGDRPRSSPAMASPTLRPVTTRSEPMPAPCVTSFWRWAISERHSSVTAWAEALHYKPRTSFLNAPIASC